MLIVSADTGVLTATVQVEVADAELWSETLIPNVEFPALDGVPEIWPEVEFNVSPCGSRPLEIVHVYGGVPPEALSVAL